MSFWKTLGKIGAAVAPFALAPFTGGGSLALTLLGSGAGLAEGALNGGGLKRDLLGAGLGAAGGLGMSALSSAPSMVIDGVRIPMETGTMGGSTAGFGSGILGKLFTTPGGTALINAGGNLIGSGITAHANGKAAELQAQAAQNALDFLKQQYATAQQQYKPFLDASTSAVGRLNGIVGNLPDPMALLGRPGATPNFASPRSATAGTVQMKAPTGEVKAVPAEQVAHYKALGAVEV